MGWPEWTGFGKRKLWKTDTTWEWQPSKTLWDWLQLLIVPAILVMIAFAYSTAQASREHRRADRAAQDAAVLAYLAQAGDLILTHKLASDKPAAELAGALTFATVHRVDGARKAEIVRYLFREKLITFDRVTHVNPILDLAEVDLHRVDLAHTNLPGDAVLRAANLRGARFDGADLTDTDFSNADLTGASFRGASLAGVVFKSAILNRAVFDGATIGASPLSQEETSFFDACLVKASFVRVQFKKETIFTDAHGLKFDDEAQRQLDNGGTSAEPCTNQGPRVAGVIVR